MPSSRLGIFRDHLRGLGDLAPRDELERVPIVAAAETADTRRQLEEDDAEREDVASAVDGLGLRLLRRHVADLPRIFTSSSVLI